MNSLNLDCRKFRLVDDDNYGHYSFCFGVMRSVYDNFIQIGHLLPNTIIFTPFQLKVYLKQLKDMAQLMGFDTSKKIEDPKIYGVSIITEESEDPFMVKHENILNDILNFNESLR